MDITTTNQNWLITPAALAFAERPPVSILGQKWLLVLTGIATASLPGNNRELWLNTNLSFLPDMAGPLDWAILKYKIPRPAPSNFDIGFAVDELASFVSLSAISNYIKSLDDRINLDLSPYAAIDTGYAVNGWQPNTFAIGYDASFKDGAENISAGVNIVENIFTGVNVDVGVRDTDATILSLGYNITLRGRIVFTSTTSPRPPLVNSIE